MTVRGTVRVELYIIHTMLCRKNREKHSLLGTSAFQIELQLRLHVHALIAVYLSLEVESKEKTVILDMNMYGIKQYVRFK